jgi:outer membrane protein assembly factor BamB
MGEPSMTVDDLLFVAFNGRVLAVDRRSGVVMWRWECDRRSFVAILPRPDAVFVSCDGYTWALDPWTGAEIWHQPFKGEGTGVPMLGTMSGVSDAGGAAAEEARRAAEQAAAAAG